MEHNTSLEKDIKCYIEKITDHLTKGKSRITVFNQNIQKIKSQIENFDKNYRQIHKSDKYLTINSIIQHHVTGNIGPIYQIFRTLVDYRNDLREFNKYKLKLFNYISLLESYSNDISNIETNNSEKLSDYISSVNIILGKLEGFKAYLGEFDKNMEWVKKLKEIGQHISIMKSTLRQVESKVVEGAKDYIKGLSNIDIDYSEFNRSFTKIKSIAESLIEKLKIAKKAIDLYNQIDSEASKVTDVNFTSYDIDELIKNSYEIKKKLESFQTISVTTNSNTETIPSEIKETHQKYSSDVSSYESLINYLLYEISFVIYTYYLLQIMILYSAKISDIDKRINGMDEIDKGLKSLPEIVKDLVTFYRVHNALMNILIVFNFISLTRYYINKYVYNFILVNYYAEILIFSILCYYKILSLLKFLQDVLQSIISNRLNLIPESKEIKVLRGFTSRTNRSLKSIRCNMISLKTLGDNLNVKNVKYNLDKIRTCIKEISEETKQIKNNIVYINKGEEKLYIINFKIIYTKKYVGQIIKKIISFIDYIYFYYIIVIFVIEKRYTKKEKTFVFLIHSNSIFNVVEILKKIEKEVSNNEYIYKGFIGNFISQLISVTNNIDKLTREMDEYVKIIQKMVIQVERAIEGVARNLIKCSTKQLSTNLISLNRANNNRLIKDIGDEEVDNRVVSMYSVMSVMDYMVVS